MLFVIPDDVAAQLGTDSASHVLRAALSRLLASFNDGYHVVIMSPQACREVEKSLYFSEAERAAAKSIRNRHADFGSLAARVQLYGIVTASGDNPARQGNEWLVPLRWLANHPLGLVELISEDLHDTNVLKGAACDHLEREGLRAFRIQLHQVPGGGINTGRTLMNAAVVDQRICVCVVDSDRTHPASNVGATAQACLNISGDGVFEVVVTNGRSIENLLPWRLIDLFFSDVSPSPSATLLSMRQRSPFSTSFLNFKSGICGHEFLKSGPQACDIYWKEVGAATVGEPACCPSICNADKAASCQHTIHSGFGRPLLGKVSDWINENLAFGRANKYLPSPNDSDWRQIGQLIGAYALGVNPRRI
jgi:hypothetical protein